jgi:hypothetical protein
LTVVLRIIGVCCSVLRLTRLVKAREIDIVRREQSVRLVKQPQGSSVLSRPGSRWKAFVGLCEGSGISNPVLRPDLVMRSMVSG